ncbi:MAG: hypothetical protein HQL41_11290 [Alphaproteobacteria bacterium]|nr:hypothetical protein [Alphaproteobacteria bacterium]
MSDDAHARKERLRKLRERAQPAPQTPRSVDPAPTAGGGARMAQRVLRLLSVGPKLPGSRVSQPGMVRLAELLNGHDGPLVKRVLTFLSQPGEPRVAGLSVAQAEKLLDLLSRRNDGGDALARLDAPPPKVEPVKAAPPAEPGWVSTLEDDFF